LSHIKNLISQSIGRLEGLTIFILQDTRVVEVQEAESAEYNGLEWIAKGVVRQANCLRTMGRDDFRYDYDVDDVYNDLSKGTTPNILKLHL